MRDVKRTDGFVLVALATLTLAAVGATSFDEAKRRADFDEGALVPSQVAALTQAQGAVIGEAFASCMPRPAPQPLPAFVVVMELNAEGKVVNTWSRGDPSVVSCMERQFSKSLLFRPPRVPFFTSFAFHPK